MKLWQVRDSFTKYWPFNLSLRYSFWGFFLTSSFLCSQLRLFSVVFTNPAFSLLTPHSNVSASDARNHLYWPLLTTFKYRAFLQTVCASFFYCPSFTIFIEFPDHLHLLFAYRLYDFTFLPNFQSICIQCLGNACIITTTVPCNPACAGYNLYSFSLNFRSTSWILELWSEVRIVSRSGWVGWD